MAQTLHWMQLFHLGNPGRSKQSFFRLFVSACIYVLACVRICMFCNDCDRLPVHVCACHVGVHAWEGSFIYIKNHLHTIKLASQGETVTQF